MFFGTRLFRNAGSPAAVRALSRPASAVSLSVTQASQLRHQRTAPLALHGLHGLPNGAVHSGAASERLISSFLSSESTEALRRKSKVNRSLVCEPNQTSALKHVHYGYRLLRFRQHHYVACDSAYFKNATNRFTVFHLDRSSLIFSVLQQTNVQFYLQFQHKLALYLDN